MSIVLVVGIKSTISKFISKFAVGVVAGVMLWTGVAAATNYWGTPITWENVPQQNCYYGYAMGRVPGNANNDDLDYNAYIYKRKRSSTTGCSLNNEPKYFYSNEAYIQPILLRTSDVAICAGISPYLVPGGTWSNAGWGIGTKVADTDCPNNTHWEIWNRLTYVPLANYYNAFVNVTAP
jgi:hypothetical protein